MSFSLGIVGLPNVGKSTLFNAITKLQVPVENYPFVTIEPNVGVVAVPDSRLNKLAPLENSKKVLPSAIEFKDIAGLVKNAHRGAGLGNQFLSHIREVDAIVEVVRIFEDENVTHVEGSIDVKRDIETIETELILADLQMIEKRLESLKSAAKSGKHEDVLKSGMAQKYSDALSAGRMASAVKLTEEEQHYLHEFPLLTRKPVLYVLNTNHNAPQPPLILREGEGELSEIVLDCQLESELSGLEEQDRVEYLKELGMDESGLDKLIRASYKLLDLITFFTINPNETHAWTCPVGASALKAAGIVHTDFEKGFIKAEVINWKDLVDSGGFHQAREKGLLRQEGKNYIVTDGDVILVKFNVS